MKKTELIINDDGSIFHLHLKPEDIAEDIVIVGDQGRVELFASLLDSVRVRKQNREFSTVTGYYRESEVTIISSGIGTDNIDIVINELDALVNIDLESAMPRPDPVSLNLVRVGTSGSLQGDLPAGTFLLTETAVGFDGLLHFYSEYDHLLDTALSDAIVYYTEWPDNLCYPYAVNADPELLKLFEDNEFRRGITISAPGFYAPQGRRLRLEPFDSEINDKLSAINLGGRRITNYEMESSAIYGLGRLLGHRTLTVCLIIGNRITGEFLSDYKPLMKKLASSVLENLPFGKLVL
ncbi:MAG: nucleoside phosphorylase [Bacteroidales bacterium]|jgi:uridine phosphorylase|nr:nucleoside phosphorylase [Bacteroidales bacterium]